MALLVLGGCSGGTDLPQEPVLTYVSIEPKTIKQITDSVTITFKFTDGDGDLGLYRLDGEDTLTSVLYVTDTRIDTDTLFPPATFLWEYPIDEDLMPASNKKTVLGKMSIKLGYLQSLQFGNDRTSFRVQLYDRANNASNIIETDSITITP